MTQRNIAFDKLTMLSGATAGYVLTTDAQGNVTAQAASGGGGGVQALDVLVTNADMVAGNEVELVAAQAGKVVVPISLWFMNVNGTTDSTGNSTYYVSWTGGGTDGMSADQWQTVQVGVISSSTTALGVPYRGNTSAIDNPTRQATSGSLAGLALIFDNFTAGITGYDGDFRVFGSYILVDA